MAKCTICGARINDGAIACPSCGAKVSATGATAGTVRFAPPASAPLTRTACPSCGTEIEGEHRFCPQCGTLLEENNTQQSIPVSAPVKAYPAGNSYAVSPEEQARMDADSWRGKCGHCSYWNLEDAGLYKPSFHARDFFSSLILSIALIWGIFNIEGFGWKLVFWTLLIFFLITPLILFILEKNIFGLAAKFANPNSLCELGYRYYYGAGISQSHSKAIEYFLLSADRGDSAAKYNLGYMYYYGHGVAQSFRKAAEYFQQACSAT